MFDTILDLFSSEENIMFEKYKILGEDYVLISLNENNAILLCTNNIKIKDNTRENLDYSVTILFMNFNNKSVYKTRMSLYLSKITYQIDYLFDIESEGNNILVDELLEKAPSNSFIYRINDYIKSYII